MISGWVQKVTQHNGIKQYCACKISISTFQWIPLNKLKVSERNEEFDAMVGFVLVRRGCVAARWRWCPVRGSATFSAKSRRTNGARGRTFWRGISSAWRRCGWTSTRSTTSIASATTPVITGTYPRGSHCGKSFNANLSSGIWRTFSPRCSFPTRPEPLERYPDGQLFGWLIDLIDRLMEWLPLFYRLIDWSIDWLIGR